MYARSKVAMFWWWQGAPYAAISDGGIAIKTNWPKQFSSGYFHPNPCKIHSHSSDNEIVQLHFISVSYDAGDSKFRARSYMFSVHVPGKMFSKQVLGTRAFRLRALWNVLGTHSFRFEIGTHLGLRSMTYCAYNVQRVEE